MGSSTSKQITDEVKLYEQLELQALKNYDDRIKSYYFPRHGPYFDYMQWCLAQYQLECIPPSCRQGSAYIPQYDNWGNKYF